MGDNDKHDGFTDVANATTQYQMSIDQLLNGEIIGRNVDRKHFTGAQALAPLIDLDNNSVWMDLTLGDFLADIEHVENVEQSLRRISVPVRFAGSGVLEQSSRLGLQSILHMASRHLNQITDYLDKSGKDPYKNNLFSIEHANEHAVLPKVIRVLGKQLGNPQCQIFTQQYGSNEDYPMNSPYGPYLNILGEEHSYKEKRHYWSTIGQILAEKYRIDPQNLNRDNVNALLDIVKDIYNHEQLGQIFALLVATAAQIPPSTTLDYLIRNKVKYTRDLLDNYGFLKTRLNNLLSESGYLIHSRKLHSKVLEEISNFASNKSAKSGVTFITSSLCYEVGVQIRTVRPQVSFLRLPAFIRQQQRENPSAKRKYGNFRDPAFSRYIEEKYGDYIVSTFITGFMRHIEFDTFVEGQFSAENIFHSIVKKISESEL